MNGIDDTTAEDGRQYERTALAHWRTTLAAAAVGLLLVRGSDEGVERAVALLGALGALLAVGGFGYWRRTMLHRGQVAVGSGAFAGVVGAVVVMQVIALLVVL